MKVSNYILLLTTIFIFSIPKVNPNIDNLKGTYSILKDEYKHLSIIHGAIADEKDYLMKLYDYGALGDKVEKPDQAGVVHKVPDTTNAAAVIKLVHLFFHRNPGATNRTDFVLTKKLLDASAEDKKRYIGTIAIMIGVAQTTKKITALDGRMKAILKQNNLQEFAQSFKGFILNSYIEENRPDATFPPNTTNTVLLGIVYRLAGDDKALMKIFYEKLNEIIGDKGSIFVDGKIHDDWETEKFDITQKKFIATEIKKINHDKTESVVNNFEYIVYIFLSPGELYPPIPGFKKARFNYETGTASFSDCMDTAFRTFYNILFYENGGFNLSKIPGLKINPKMQVFYTAQSKATMVGDQEFHDAWTNVIENIPFVAYNHKVGIEEPAAKKSFIKIPENVSNPERFDLAYQRGSVTDFVYEIQPSLKNIIIATNYLLGLNLFDEEQIEGENNKIAQALLRSDFIKYYFPKMCKKLKINVENWKTELGDIDQIDYTSTNIETFLNIRSKTGGSDVKINTSSGHGEIKILIIEEEESENLNQLLETKDSRLYSLPYFVYSINSYLFKPNKEFSSAKLLNVLFWLPINNPGFVINFVNDALNLNTTFSSHFLKALLYLTSKIPDDHIKQLSLIKIGTLIVKSKDWNPNKGLFNLPESTADAISQIAIDSIKYKEPDIHKSAFSLYKALFEKNQGFKSAIQWATQSIKIADRSVRFDSLALFRLLFEKSQGIDSAIQTASEYIKSSDIPAKYAGMNLFELLFEKNQGIDSAIQTASECLKSSDIHTQCAGMDLFELLVKNEQSLDRAIQAASTGIKSSTPDIHISALSLWKALFEYANKNDTWRQEIIEAGLAIDQSSYKWQKILQMAKALEAKFPQSDHTKQDLIKLKSMSMEMKYKFGSLRQGLTNLQTRLRVGV